MRLFHISFLFIFGCLAGCRPDHKASIFARKAQYGEEIRLQNNGAYQWGEKALEATARDTERFTPRPTVTSRFLALTFTAMYDAWSRFDDKASPVYLQHVDRRPASDRHEKNKEVAVSYAAYGALCEYFFLDTLLFREHMIKLGLDPDRRSEDPSTPEGIGYLAAKAVIEARKKDGSNQYGDEPSSDDQPYTDYTGYQPVNTADKNTHPDRWQPKYFADRKGGKFAPGCLTPHWHRVKPIALGSADRFRSPPPPSMGSAQLKQEVREVVELQATLTPDQKALVEFMRDGPASVQQAGHWLKFAMNVSVRDHHSLDQDILLFFLTEVAAMDAFIACWDTKMHYDFARPQALIHHDFKGQDIYGWAGPEQGWRTLKGEEWRPYSPDEFLCPAFPAYVSGHSTVSGACSEVLRLFTGEDHFGEKIKWVPGHLTEPDHVGDTVVIEMPTFSATAEMAGISRVLGGYHIQADNVEGLVLGRKVGNEVYTWYLKKMTGIEPE